MTVGVAILLLTVGRLVVRYVTPLLERATAGHVLLDWLGIAIHYGLYAAIILTAISGIATAVAAGLPAIVFGDSSAPRPAGAALCASDRSLPCDGSSARKRPPALWKGAYPGRLQPRCPGGIRPCACNAAHRRRRDVYGHCPERPRLRHGVLGYCRNCDRQFVRWADRDPWHYRENRQSKKPKP
jgi:hypothetical protein